MTDDAGQDKGIPGEKSILDDALGTDKVGLEDGEKPQDGSGQEFGSEVGEDSLESKSSSVRRMVEDITVTPFFDRHAGHMPATIKLHAELRQEKDFIIFESSIPDFSEEDVKVEASFNTITVSLLMDKEEGKDEEDVFFHSSFVTPKPIEYEKIKIEHKDGLLRIKAPIKKD
ncbi:Hsp20/alpha crystallin family protein [Candidatus Altiarchaeota archaeon]